MYKFNVIIKRSKRQNKINNKWVKNMNTIKSNNKNTNYKKASMNEK